MDCSPPGSPVPGTLQARTPEWIAISFSNAWKWKVKGKSLSCVRLSATLWTAAYQAPPSMGPSRQEYWSGLPLPSPPLIPSIQEIPKASGVLCPITEWKPNIHPWKFHPISLPLSWNDLLLYCFRYLSLLIVLFSVICGGGLVAQSCLTLGDSTDCSLPGSSVHGILQARILEGIIISFSKGTSWPRDQTQVSYIVVSLLHCRRILYQLSHLSWWTVISSKLLSLIWV